MSAKISALNPSSVWRVPDAFRSIYTHATRLEHGSALLFVSGQFGVRPDGTLPIGFAEQAAQALSNIEALLSASDMSIENIVKLNYFLTRSGDASELVKLRAEKWDGLSPPAVTVLTVSALARPEYLVEIEAVAAA